MIHRTDNVRSASFVSTLARIGVVLVGIAALVFSYASFILPAYVPMIFGGAGVILGYVALRNTSAPQLTKKTPSLFFYAVFASIVVLAVSIRVWVLPIGVLPVDSFYHFLAAQQMLHGSFPEYSRGIVYTALLAISQGIFGQSTTVGMVMNLCINIVTLFVCTWIVKKYFSQSIALMVALFLALSPWSIIMSHYVRMYDLLQLLIVVLLFAVYRLFSSPPIYSERFRVRAYLAACAACIAIFSLSVSVHSLTLGYVPILGGMLLVRVVYICIKNLRQGHASLALRDPSVILFLLFVCVSCVVLVSMPHLLGQLRNAFTFNIDIQALIVEERGYYQFLTNQLPQPAFFYGIGLAIAVACVYAFSSSRYAYVVGVAAFSAIELWFFDRYFSPRYGYHVLPLITVCFAIGVWVYARIATTVTQRLFSRMKPHTVFFVWCSMFTLACIPYGHLRELLHAQSSGEDQIYELYYPYAEALRTITVQPDDGLFSYNVGIWNVMQNTSDNIHAVYMQDEDGNLKDRKEVATSFFTDLSTYPHAWFLADEYRQKRWDCTLPEMPDCVVREFVNEAWTLEPERSVDNLMLYEWNLIPVRGKQHLNDDKFNNFDGGSVIDNLAWLRSTKVFVDNDHEITGEMNIRSLMQNTKGVFVVLHPTIRLSDKQKTPLNTVVLFVPPRTDSAQQLAYQFSYTAQDGAKISFSDVISITATYSVLDINTLTLTKGEDAIKLYKKN
ncbi:MAG: hypothetical protein KIH62_002580 [Candidatus Kerfeldbacteria bacterium]|nr:hypothetical protein [Candidatus Kerfeldbacteria bacterium]